MTQICIYLTELDRLCGTLNDVHVKCVLEMGLIVLIGLPGSGKSTFCKTLDDGKSILLGDLLRQKNDPNIESCMRSGILVPYDITISVIKDNIKCSDKEEKILDVVRKRKHFCIKSNFL